MENFYKKFLENLFWKIKKIFLKNLVNFFLNLENGSSFLTGVVSSVLNTSGYLRPGSWASNSFILSFNSTLSESPSKYSSKPETRVRLGWLGNKIKHLIVHRLETLQRSWLLQERKLEVMNTPQTKIKVKFYHVDCFEFDLIITFTSFG